MDPEKRKHLKTELYKRAIDLGAIGGAAGQAGKGLFKALPLIGNVMSAGSGVYNLAKGNFADSALDFAGMIPVVGNYISLGRLGASLAGGGGQPQPQPQRPQYPMPPGYGKMAAFRGYDKASLKERCYAFEAGVERFCKEASFDEEDKKALFQLMLKQAIANPMAPMGGPAPTGGSGGGGASGLLPGTGLDPNNPNTEQLGTGLGGALGGAANSVDKAWTGVKNWWNGPSFMQNFNKSFAGTPSTAPTAWQQKQWAALAKSNPKLYMQQELARQTSGEGADAYNKTMMDARVQAMKFIQTRHMDPRRAARLAFRGLGQFARGESDAFLQEQGVQPRMAGFGTGVNGPIGGGPTASPAAPPSAPGGAVPPPQAIPEGEPQTALQTMANPNPTASMNTPPSSPPAASASPQNGGYFTGAPTAPSSMAAGAHNAGAQAATPKTS